MRKERSMSLQLMFAAQIFIVIGACRDRCHPWP